MKKTTDTILFALLAASFWIGGYKLGAKNEQVQVIAAALPRKNGLPIAETKAVPTPVPAPVSTSTSLKPVARVKPAVVQPTPAKSPAQTATQPVAVSTPPPAPVSQPQPTTKAS